VTAEESKAANKDAEGARTKGKLTNALENALTAAAANGGQMQLRPKRGRDAGEREKRHRERDRQTEREREKEERQTERKERESTR
jgi:hypothetical protein